MTARDHRPALNALRGFAALIVVVYHFRYYSPFPWFETFPALSVGYLGVDFFFVLSGLVISHVYLDGFLAGRESLPHFLFLRISRLFPVHALIMVAMLVCTLAGGRAISGKAMADWISLTFLVREWLIPHNYAWNSPAWSVSAEMFAYAFIFPLVVAIARRRDRGAAGLTLLGFGIAVLAILGVAAGTLNIIPSGGPLIRVTGGFMVGAGIYCLLSLRKRGANWDAAIVGGAALMPAAIPLGSDFAVLTVLTVITAGAYMSTGKVAAWLASRPLYFFGEISFSLYLCHIPIFEAAKKVAEFSGIARGPAFCVMTAGICLLAAAALYKLVEVPARSALRRWWDTRRPTGALPALSER